MMRLLLGALLLGVFLTVSGAPASEARKVIIDTDPGIDDALAILLALNSPELDVQAITVVPGNVAAQQGLENALKLVSLAGRCDVPVAAGAERPLAQQLITAELWHGLNGLANLELPASKCKADPRFGPELIIELVHKYPHQITLLPVGPETNIALALSKDASIIPLVKEVVLMGGSISGGNASASAEANIYGDPEAASIVFNAGWPLTMVGLDVGERTLITRAHMFRIAKTRGPQSDFVVGLVKFIEESWVEPGAAGAPMYDPLAVGAVIDRSLIRTQDMRVDIELRGRFTRGETVANRHNRVARSAPHGDHLWVEAVDPVEPNARVSVGVDAARFLDMFVKRMEGK